MKAADTNVLVRVLARDDPAQTAAAEAFLADGAWVSLISLAEAVWVLRSRYGRNRAGLIAAVALLVDRTDIVLEDAAMVSAALDLYRGRPRLNFTDCLLLEQARAAGNLPLGTFDRELAKAPGAVLL